MAKYKSGDSFRHVLRSFFLWIIFICILRHISRVQLSCLKYFVEDQFYHFFRLIVTGLDVLGKDSIVVAGFAFLELVDCCLNFFICDQRYFFIVTFTIVSLRPDSRYSDAVLQFHCLVF